MIGALAPKVHARPLARAALVAALATCATQGGCLSQTYAIRSEELARLATLPPEMRGARVEVEQELFGSNTEAAPPVTARTQVVVVGGVNVSSGGPRRPADARPVPTGGGGGPGGGGRGGGKAWDAKEAAAAVLVLATVGLVIAAVVESQRFEGTVQLHPMYPVHLFGRDGGYAIVPLAQLDLGAAQWADHAVIRSNEGPFLTLDRAPLRRTGLTYGVHFGVTELASADGTKSGGANGTIQFGYFASQHLGLLATGSFAWRENLVHLTLYEQRYGVELQFMPLAVDIFHAGLYAGGGLAWRIEDGFSRGADRGLAGGGGVQVQLDVNTHVALTGRAGVHSGHGESLSEFSFGMAVY
jgi:hypothetical protein